MKQRSGLLVGLILLGVLVASPTSQASPDGVVERHYRGLVGGRFPVYLRLRVEGRKLTGSYVYERIGDDIELAGEVTAANDFVLSEHAGRAGGKNSTGMLRGAFVGADRLVGTWSSGGGAKKLGFKLAAAGATVRHVTAIRGVATISFGRVHAEVVYPQVEGLANRNAEDQINQFLRAHVSQYEIGMDCAQWEALEEGGQDLGDSDPSGRRCVEASDYVIRYNADGILSLVVKRYDDTGGPYPNTRDEVFAVSLETGERIRVRDVIRPDAMRRFAELVERGVNRCLRGGRTEGEICRWGGDSSMVLDRRRLRMNLECSLVHAVQVCGIADLPFSRIRDLIDPSGYAGRFMDGRRDAAQAKGSGASNE